MAAAAAAAAPRRTSGLLWLGLAAALLAVALAAVPVGSNKVRASCSAGRRPRVRRR
jgi:hypothetical protein